MIADRRPLDGTAFALMLTLTALWGLQQVAIKLALHGVSPVMQGALRSIAATALLFVWARARGIRLFDRDRTLAAGLGAGFLFAAEFFFIYYGLQHTSASRMVVFIYLAPILTALGLSFALPGERLSAPQWLGVGVAFGGLVVAFADGFKAGGTLLGDSCGVIAAVLWAATTVLIRRSSLASARAEKTLFYQLAVSALLLPLGARALGEAGVMQIDATVAVSLVFQGVVVAFASYLAWFWLLTRYLAARLSVFSFLAPLFGVLFGVAILNERLTPSFALAAALVGGGIALVNVRR
jgi:drug/metabolite transporter (DMT)-like permease